MHRIDTEGSINGSFSEGDPSLGVLGTKVSADWLNDIQETIAYVIEASGLALEKGNPALLANAIESFFEQGNFTAIETRIRNLNSSYLHGADQVIRSATRPVDDPNKPFKDNDLWIDISVEPNLVYQWNSLTKMWTNVGAATGGQAVLAAQKLKAISDGFVDIFIMLTPPENPSSGDIWYNNRDDLLFFLEDGEWVRVHDEFVRRTIITGIINEAAKDANALADSKIRTYYQPNPPTGLSGTDNGDLWFDIDDGNKVYRYAHPEWVLVQDQNINKAFDLMYLQSAIADGTINVYFSKVAPTAANQAALDPPNAAPSEGDLWIDISLDASNNPKNNPYLFDGGIWRLQTDPQLKSYLLSFANYRSIMDGKVTIYFSETPPDDTFRPKPDYGDIWFDTSIVLIPDVDADNPTANPIGVPAYRQYRYDPNKTPKWISIEDFSIKLLFANLKTIGKALTDADSAIAASVTEANTQIGNNRAIIQEALVSLDGIAASYGVVTNVNNKVVGFGYLTDYDSKVEFTRPIGADYFRPADQVFIGATWETRTWDAKIVTVDNVNGSMKVINEVGVYANGTLIKVRDRLDAKATTSSKTLNPTPGVSEFEVMVDRFKISDGVSSIIPFRIEGGVVYIGSIDTSKPQITYIGDFNNAPDTNREINSVYRNNTDGNSYILQYVAGSSGAKQWNVYLQRGSNAKFLLLTSNAPYYTFPDNTVTDPSNEAIRFKASYQGQADSIGHGDIKVYDVNNTLLTTTLENEVSADSTASDSGGFTHNGSFEFDLPYFNFQSDNFPINVVVAKGGFTDTIQINRLVGSTSVSLSISPDTFFFLFEDESSVSPQNTEILFQIAHQNLNTAPRIENIHIEDGSGAVFTPINFVSAPGGTGKTTFTLPWTVVTTAVFPLVVTVSDENLTDVTTIRKLVGGVDAITGLLTNESHVMPADETGVVDASSMLDAKGFFDIYRGSEKQNAAYTYSVFEAVGATATISTTGAYQVTSMTANRATITFQAINNGVPIRKTMSLAKSIAGVNARNLRLASTQQVFEFDGDNKPKSSTATISFTATAVNLGAVTWTATNDAGNPVTLSGTGSTRTLSISSFGSAQRVSVTASASYSGVNYSDTITVARLVEGTKSVQVILSNENHSFFADEFGVIDPVDYNDGNTTISVYRGTTAIAYNATPTNNTFRFGTVFVSSGVVRDASEVAPVFGISALGDDFGYADIPVIYRDPNGVDITLLRRVSYSKVRAGFNARVLRLSSDAYTFEFNGDDKPINASQLITFTAFSQNLTSISFAAVNEIGSSLVLTGSGNTRSLSISNFGASNRATITVTATYNDGSATNTLVDKITVVKLKGITAAVSALLSNESHTFSADADGVISPSSFAAGDCTVRVLRGAEEISYNATPTNNTFRFGTITVANVTRDTTKVAPTVGINAMTGDSGSLAIRIIYRDPNGIDRNIDRQISYARARTGASARSVILSASSQIFAFDAYNIAINNTDSITFNATKTLIGEPLTWTATNDSNVEVTLTGTGDSRTLPIANFASANSVKVRASVTTTINGASYTYFDEISVVRLKQGSDAITVVVENESHTFAADETGAVADFSNGNTNIRVYRGTGLITYSATAANNRFRLGTITTTGVTRNASLTAPLVGVNAMATDTGIMTVPVIYRDPAGVDTTVTKIISYARSRRGIAARNIRLVSSQQTFAFNGDNQAVSSTDSVIFTAIRTNVDTAVFTAKDQNNNNLVLSGSGDTRTLTIANFGSSQSAVVTAIATSVINGVTTTFSDQITIVRIRDGAEGLQIVLSNEAHSFYADEEGHVLASEYPGGNSAVRIFRGSNEIAYSSTPTANTFSIGDLIGTNVTPASLVGANVGISAMDPDATSGSLVVPIIYRPVSGANVAVSKQISYTKSVAGTDARSLSLYSSDQIFLFAGDDITPADSAQVITFTAIRAFLDNITWTAVDEEGTPLSLMAGPNDDIKKIRIQDFGASKKAIVTVTSHDAITNINYTDTVTLTRIKQGVQGQDALQVVLSNENHTFFADELGVVSNYGSGNTTVTVLLGSNNIPYSASQVNNTWRFGTFASTNVTRNASLAAPVVGITGMSDDFGVLSIPVIYTNSDGVNATIIKTISYSKSRAGTSARVLRLSASAMLFAFDSQNQPSNTTQSITVTANKTNLGTTTWAAVDQAGTNRAAWLTGSGDARSISIANFGASEFLLVTVSATSNSITYTDTVRLQRVKDGADSLTVVGSNEDHTFVADEGGLIPSADFDGGNCTFTVYRGVSVIPYNATATNNTWRFGTFTLTGVVRDTTEIAPTVGISAMQGDTGSMVVPIIYRNAVGADTTINRTVAYSKTRAGRDARWVSIVPSEQVFRYTGDNIAQSTSQAITFTLFGNLIDLATATVTAEDQAGSALVLTGTGNTRTLTISNFGASTFALVKVSASVTVNGVTQTVNDQVTVARVRDGATNVQVMLSNESHTYAADEAGVVSNYASGNSTITVYRGLAAIAYNATATNNTWRFGTFVTSNVVRNTSLAAPAVGITSMSQDSGTLTVPVIYRDPNGVDSTINRVITFAKSRAGKMARSLQLYASAQIFAFSELDQPVSSADVITFTSINVNLTTPSWSAVNDAGDAVSLTAGVSGDEKILSVNNFGNAKWVKVSVTNTYDGTTYTDVITVTRVTNGQSNIQAILTNENHSFSASETGAVSNFGQGDSEVKVYRGSTAIPFHLTNNNAWRFGTMVGTNVTANSSLLPPFVGISAMAQDIGSLNVPIIYRDQNGAETTVTKTISYNKARAGVNARNLRLMASGQQFNYDSTNAPSNSTQELTFTAFSTFISSSITWSAVNQAGTALTLTGTGATRKLSIANFGSATSAIVTISVNDTVNGTTTSYTDQITIVRVKDGNVGINGQDGVSALQAILSNENTTFALDAQGGYIGSLADANSSVTVYMGTTAVAYNATATINTWRFGTFTPTNVTRNTSLAAPAVGISAMSADQGSLAVQIIYRTAGGQDVTLNRVINYSRAKAGYDSREFFMISDRQLFEFDGDNKAKNTSAATTFAVTKSSTIGNVTFTAINDGGSGVTLSNGSNAVQKILTIANFAASQWVKVTASATDSVTSTVYSDTITIHRVVDGSTTVQVLSTNEAHTFKADENGAITSALTDGNTTVRVFRGSSEIAFNATATNNTFRFGSHTTTSGLSVSRTNATFSVSSLSADAATLTIPVIYRDPNGVDTTFSKVISYTKARSGVVARSLSIEASGLSFLYDGDNQVKNGLQTITFNGNGYNISDPYTWTIVNEAGTTLKTVSGASVTLNTTEFGTSARATITASKTVVVDGSNVTLSDKATVYRLRDAQSGIQVILTNESHTFAANADGFVLDYSGGNTNIIVYRGLDIVNYSATAANNTWRYGLFTTTDVTRNTSVVAPELGISMLAANSGYLDFEIIYRDAAGIDTTVKRRVSYSKTSQAGDSLNAVTVIQTNPTTTFSTDKEGNLLPSINYAMGDSTISVFNGDETLAHSLVRGQVNTFFVESVNTQGCTRNASLSLPTVGITQTNDIGKLTLNIIPYLAKTEITNYGFEFSSVGSGAPFYGWTTRGTDTAFIQAVAANNSVSKFKSSRAVGRTSGSGTGYWVIGKRFSLENASYIDFSAMAKATATPRVAFSGTATQTHVTTDDVYVTATFRNASGAVVGSVLNTRTLSHDRFYTTGNTASYAGQWVPFKGRLTVPTGAVMVTVEFVCVGGSSASVQSLGFLNTSSNSNMALDDVEITSDGALYDTTVETIIPVVVSYSKARTGQDAVLYYIKPLNGTALKNKAGGPLSGELRKVEGTSDTLVQSGPINLYRNGVSLGYTYSLTSAQITGSTVIEAKAGVAGTVYDSLTLLDITDGLGGGVVEASNGFTLIQPNAEVYAFTPASTVLTASFYAPGTTANPITRSATVDAAFNGSTPRIRWTIGTGSSAITVTGKFNNGNVAASGTYLDAGTSVTLTFTYTDSATGQSSTISETVFRTNAGTRGSRQFYATTTGSVWSDSVADSAITSTGTIKVLNDIVTISNASAGFSQTRFWNGTTWATVAQVIDGNLVVQGTLGADRIASGLIQTALLTIGAGAKLTIDGTSEAIIVRDANNAERVRLGKLGNNAYGINIYDTNGQVIISSGGVSAAALTGSINWLTQVSNTPKTFRVISSGASSTSHPMAAGIYNDAGVLISSRGRSYVLAIFDRATRALDSSQLYDVYSGTASVITSLVNALNAVPSTKIIALYGFDEPMANRLTNGLPDAIYRCGGSRNIFGNSNNFKRRGAYVLIGIPGCGEGNGIEIYKGTVDDGTDSWIDTSFTISPAGGLETGGTNLRTAADLIYGNGQTVDALRPSEAGSTVGAILGSNLKNPSGVVLTGSQLLNSEQTWNDVANKPGGIYNSSDAMVAGFNVGFENWAGTYPDGWLDWSSSGARTSRVAGITGNNGIRFSTTGTNTGITSRGGKWSTKPAGTPVKISFDYKLERYVSGSPGLLFDANDDGTNGRTACPIENTEIGVWQRYTKVIYPRVAFSLARIYLMGAWSGMPGGMANADIVYDNVDFDILDETLYGAKAGTNLKDASGNVLNDASIITSQGTAADSRTGTATWKNGFEGDDYNAWSVPAGNTLNFNTDSFEGGRAGAFYSTTTTAANSWPGSGSYCRIPAAYSASFSGSVRRVSSGNTETVNQRIEVSVFAKRGNADSFAVSYGVDTVLNSPWQVFTPVAGAYRQFKFTYDIPPNGTDKYHYIGILGSATGGNLYTLIDSVTVRLLPAVEETQNAGFWARLNTAINAGNISTYISSAAIGDAYIVNLHGSKIDSDSIETRHLKAKIVKAGNIEVDNLAAINSNLGNITGGSLNISNKFMVDAGGNVTIRSATSGARLEMSNTLIRIYDNNGTMRIRMGIW